MRAFLATVLSVIAVGVVLITYGLLAPRVVGQSAYPNARPMLARERVGYVDDQYPVPDGYGGAYAGTVRRPMPYAASYASAAPQYAAYTSPAPPRVATVSRARAVPVSRVERSGGRDWTKT